MCAMALSQERKPMLVLVAGERGAEAQAPGPAAPSPSAPPAASGSVPPLKEVLAYHQPAAASRALYWWLRREAAAQRREPAAGQIHHPAVAYSEPPERPAEECRKVWVCLTLESPADLHFLRRGGGGVLAMQRARLLRLALEATEQGARLSLGDLAYLLGMDRQMVRRVLAELTARGIHVPVQGVPRGRQPVLSYQAAAVRLYLQCVAYHKKMGRSGCPAIRPVRFLQDYEAVARAQALGIPTHHIPSVVGLPAQIVGEYLALALQHG